MKSNAVYKIEITKCKDSSTNNTDKKANATNDLQSQVDQEGEQDWSQEPAKKESRTLYVRQTGRSCHARFKEHTAGLRRGDRACPFFKHVVKDHDGYQEDAVFVGTILKGMKNNLSRLLMEAQQISAHSNDGLLNSKSEYRGTKIIRMVLDRQFL